MVAKANQKFHYFPSVKTDGNSTDKIKIAFSGIAIGFSQRTKREKQIGFRQTFSNIIRDYTFAIKYSAKANPESNNSGWI